MRVIASEAPELIRLRDQVQSRLGLEDEAARAAVSELAKFLDLCSDAPEPLAPSTTIDEVWHLFILNTRIYAAYCDRYLGGLIHHAPTEGPETEAYARTLSLLSERFGDPDPHYWPEMGASKCDRCSSCNTG